MSTTISSAQIQSVISKNLIPAHKTDDKRLMRTSSLEKIRRFNSFICSQPYYILPALLAWLRSSQSGLEASTEKTIFFFRSLIFTHFLYKIYHIEYKQLIQNVTVFMRKQVVRIGRSPNLLRVAVFLTASVLLGELGLCFYLLCKTYVPTGLLFLIICWFYIIYLNLRSVYGQKKKSVISRRIKEN